MRQKLDRSLGLFSATTIGIGTMVGSAIFVLAGTSFEAAGPAATLSVFLAGIAAVFTAFSFAELVTIIPTAGGGYAYVREATNNGVISFICGWGFWLGYSMSCGLFALGFGNFINYLFPFIPEIIATYLLIIYVISTNIKGMENSSKLQNIITVGLMLLLFGYVIYGSSFLEMERYTPFFPEGLSGMFHAMGFLYMTYIGYGLITTASEEVVNPEKTIPRSIMISMIIVIFIKTAVFFIGSGLIYWEELIPGITETPLTDTAEVMGGQVGGIIFALAGILATVSSINTATIASSRTSFALARDQHFPAAFKVINSKTKTPIFSIIIAGIIIVISVSIRNLEHISTITSIFSLTGYSLVNVALIIFRKKEPDLERSFKAPLYPFSPIIGIALNLFLVVQLGMNNLLSLMISLGVLSLGVIYFYLGIPWLKSAPKGISPLEIPAVPLQNHNNYRKIYIPVSNPHTLDNLVNFGTQMARAEDNTVVIPLHAASVPDSIPLDSTYYGDLKETINEWQEVLGKFRSYEEEAGDYIKPMVVFSRDINHGIVSSINTNGDSKSNNNNRGALMLMGWHAHDLAYDLTGGMVTSMFEQVPTDIGVLKENNLNVNEINSILFPYGGGKYSQSTAAVAKRVADAFDADVTVMRAVDDIDSITCELEHKNQVLKAMENISKDFNVEVRQGELVDEVIKLSKEYDLIILGASLDWGLTDYITGIRSDQIVEGAECSVLVVKPYHYTLQRKGVRYYTKRVKNFLK